MSRNARIRLRKSGLSGPKDETLLRIPWGEVSDVSVEDATEVQRKSRIEHHRYGFFGGMFNEMPVARITEKKKINLYFTVTSDRGIFLFEMPNQDAIRLRGTLLASQAKRRTAALSDESLTAQADPTQQLRRLAELKEAGIVTVAEFEAKKTELLKRI